MLKDIKRQIGGGITRGDQLEGIAKQMFHKKYKGVFPIQSTADVPPLKEGEVAILNRAGHWFGAFRKKGKLYESDSYGVDGLGRGYIDKKPEAAFIQPAGATDCGSRLLVNLWFALRRP